MHLIPSTWQEWSRLFLFPFKAFTVIALPFFLMLDRGELLFTHSRVGDYIMVGYLFVGVVLVAAGLIQKLVFKSPAARASLNFGAVAIFIGIIVIPMIAPL